MLVNVSGARIGTGTLLAVLVGTIALPATVLGQGAVAGVVTDATGARAARASPSKRAAPRSSRRIRTAVTDGTGQYRIEDLRPGRYSVTFRLRGLESAPCTTASS